MSVIPLRPFLRARHILGVLAIAALVAVLLTVNTRRPADNPAADIPAGVTPVRIVRTSTGFQLQRGGQPYFIKGGGGLQYYDRLRAAGANSVRLWSTDYADDRLDEAQRHQLTVLLGVWMEHESKQFDYYDKGQVERQKEAIRRQVLHYRHHPALLAWAVGNELHLNSANPQMYQAINDIARMIHELDPYHPVTTTVLSTLDHLERIKRLCPDLDFLSINSFGELPTLAKRLQERNWTGPYVITEFGARGFWEYPPKKWGTVGEQNSTEKARFTKERYVQAILGNPDLCMGSYVFYWGNKFEYTTTWFSLFAPTGEKTATVDVMQELWSNRKPANLAPEIGPLRFAEALLSQDASLLPDTEYPAHITAHDPENDSLRFVWTLAPDMTLANNTDTPYEPLEGRIRQPNAATAVVRTPAKAGAYRLSVSVFDGKGSVATANIPFYIR